MAHMVSAGQESWFSRILRDGYSGGVTVSKAQSSALLGPKAVLTYTEALEALRLPGDTEVSVSTCYTAEQLRLLHGSVVLVPVGWCPFTIWKARPDLFMVDYSGSVYLNSSAKSDSFAGYRLTDWRPWQRHGVRDLVESVGLNSTPVSSLRTYLMHVLFMHERHGQLPTRSVKVSDRLPNGNHLAVGPRGGKVEIFEAPRGAELHHALSYIPRTRWWQRSLSA